MIFHDHSHDDVARQAEVRHLPSQPGPSRDRHPVQLTIPDIRQVFNYHDNHLDHDHRHDNHDHNPGDHSYCHENHDDNHDDHNHNHVSPGMSPARSPGTGYRPSPTTASSMWQVSVTTNKKELLFTTNYFCKNVQ